MEIEVVRRGDTCYSANKASAGDDLSMLEGNIMPCSHGRRGGEMRAMCSDAVVCGLGWLWQKSLLPIGDQHMVAIFPPFWARRWPLQMSCSTSYVDSLHGFLAEPRILFSPSGIVPQGDMGDQWWSSSSGGREENLIPNSLQ
jgi:hypothetical protein